MESILFWVGKDSARLQALLNATGDVQIGKALGYPKTALGKLRDLNTVGYLQMLQKEYTKKSVPEELLYLLFTPKFGVEGIPEEHREWGRASMNLVKTVAPDLHDEFIAGKKRAYFKVKYGEY